MPTRKPFTTGKSDTTGLPQLDRFANNPPPAQGPPDHAIGIEPPAFERKASVERGDKLPFKVTK